jgi:hypothetical protein
MSADVIVAIVFAVMFIGGIVVGFITVIAISAVRADQRATLTGQDHRVYGIPGHWDAMTDGNNHGADDDLNEDDRARWPSDSGTGQAGE